MMLDGWIVITDWCTSIDITESHIYVRMIRSTI